MARGRLVGHVMDLFGKRVHVGDSGVWISGGWSELAKLRSNGKKKTRR